MASFELVDVTSSLSQLLHVYILEGEIYLLRKAGCNWVDVNTPIYKCAGEQSGVCSVAPGNTTPKSKSTSQQPHNCTVPAINLLQVNSKQAFREQPSRDWFTT